MVKEEFSLLFAHLGDLCGRAECGELCFTGFLSPRELHFAEKELCRCGFGDRFFAYGGYGNAERCRLFVLPEYIDRCESYDDILPYCETDMIASIKISGSGYRHLTHRDYLGSLLALGIERDVIGDIAVLRSDREEAVVFCDAVIKGFILSELKKIANDSVRVHECVLPRDFAFEHSFSHISDTVASARIDCIVAALCSLSREKARTAVTSEFVEINFEVESSPDRVISAPAVVSVRGYGKFRLNSVSEQTKKGRFRLDADKYI